MGAVLNAYTSHDLVAFHITCRAEVGDGGDRPADRLRRAPEDRRRGARPRARRRHPGDRPRYKDQPSVRRRAPHRPRGVRRPSARAPRARPRGAPADVHARRRSSPSASAAGSGARGGAFLVGNLEHVPENGELAELFGRFPSISANGGLRARARRSDRRRSSRSATPTSRTCACPTARRSTSRDPKARAALHDLLDAAGRLDGLAPVRRDPRAARPRLLRLRRSTTPTPTCRSCSSRAGPGVDQVRRGVHAHARDRRRAARRRADARRRSSAPARTPPAAGCWPSRTRTPSRATRPTRRSSSARTSTPTRRSPRSTTVTFDEVARGRARRSPTRCRRLRRPARRRTSSAVSVRPGRRGSVAARASRGHNGWCA